VFYALWFVGYNVGNISSNAVIKDSNTSPYACCISKTAGDAVVIYTDGMIRASALSVGLLSYTFSDWRVGADLAGGECYVGHVFHAVAANQAWSKAQVRDATRYLDDIWS
jgi:hypothetical protein